MPRFQDAHERHKRGELSTEQLFAELGQDLQDRERRFLRFERRHKIVALLTVLALAAAITGVIWAVDAFYRTDTPRQVFKDHPEAIQDPNSILPGGEYSPSPDDIFAPPASNPNALTYPGFPRGTVFFPGTISNHMLATSQSIATRFWDRYHLHAACDQIHLHRYRDPENQVLARTIVGGCDIFLDVHTRIPPYTHTWAAVAFCNLIVHETGHAIGLLHSSNPKDIMFYTGSPRGKTGCEAFAPQTAGIVDVSQVPPVVLCAGEKATRYWFAGQYSKLIAYLQRHPVKRCP